MPEKTGIYICGCAGNVASALDVDGLVKFARGLKGAPLVKAVEVMCSEEGKSLLKKDIKEHGLTRVVVAACSPKEHEATFRAVLEEAGLNPFLLQMANIREHCSWVTYEPDDATGKAEALISAAAQRVLLQEPLETRDVDCLPDVLVVGAGVAGMSAALTLARRNRRVYVVETSPSIGGKAALLDDVFFDLNCASCVLDPLMDEFLHHEGIELFTLSEVKEVLGYFGNFLVRVLERARFVDTDTCLGCGACLEPCPVSVPNEWSGGLDERGAVYIPYEGALPNLAAIDPATCLRLKGRDCDACQKACPFGSIDFEQTDRVHELGVGAVVLATGFDLFDPKVAARYGYGKIDNVINALQFERLLSQTGPTGGEILLKDGRAPGRIALIHCAGSRTGEFHDYCSSVCCSYLLKFAHQIAQKLPEASVCGFHSTLCLPGKEAQRFSRRVRGESRVELVHMKSPDSIDISDKDGKILIRYEDIRGAEREAYSDMAVLGPAMVGARGAKELAGLFDIERDGDGFFKEAHASLDPVAATREGIFIAGCAQGPKDIPGSVAQGQAAAGKILSRLAPGERLKLEPLTCEIEEELCSGCGVCAGLCYYKAITFDTPERPTVNSLLCRGCGVCAAACPAGAVGARGFSDSQIFNEIGGLLAARPRGTREEDGRV